MWPVASPVAETPDGRRPIRRPGLPSVHARRERLAAALNAALGDELLCYPTTPLPAPPKGRSYVDRTTDSYLLPTLSFQTVSTLARLPQVTVPAGAVDGAPVGLSFLAASGRDGPLLDWLAARD